MLSGFASHFRLPIGWLSLDEGDNDYNRFWTYLITACQSVVKNAGESALELVSTTQPLREESVPTVLINDFVTQDEPAVLVLDDYHEIQSSTIHASLQYLLDHLPDNLYIHAVAGTWQAGSR